MKEWKYIMNTKAILFPVFFLLLIVSCSSNYVPLNDSKWYDNIISSYNTPPAVDGKAGYVVVKKGDTLYSIAKKYNTTTRSLIYANNMHSPYNLKVGEKIYLPSAVFHIVKKGDSLYGISRRYNVDSRSLAKANNLTYPYSIYQGQKLILPSAIESGKGRTVKQASAAQKTTAKQNTKTQSKKTTTGKAKTATKTTKQSKTSTYAANTTANLIGVVFSEAQPANTQVEITSGNNSILSMTSKNSFRSVYLGSPA